MECWNTNDEGILVQLDPESTCKSDDGGSIYVLLDGFGEIERIWQDDEESEGGVVRRTSHEIEDASFVSVMEERFPSGRTNYDREIEIDDLEPLEEDQWPDEEKLRALLRRFVRRSGPARS